MKTDGYLLRSNALSDQSNLQRTTGNDRLLPNDYSGKIGGDRRQHVWPGLTVMWKKSCIYLIGTSFSHGL